MSKYEEGSAEGAAYSEGVEAERTRALKVLESYHKRFCEGEIEDHADCKKTMEIRYLYNYIVETRSLT